MNWGGDGGGEVSAGLSLDFVWAQSLCLLSSLTFLGKGARAAVGRRQQVTRKEEEKDSSPLLGPCEGEGCLEGGAGLCPPLTININSLDSEVSGPRRKVPQMVLRKSGLY